MLATIAEKYLSWRGRIRRRTYWLRSVAAAILVGVLALLGEMARPYAIPAAVALIGLAMLVGGLVCASLVVRRFHDLGRRGWIGLACLAVAALVGSAGQWIDAGLPAMTIASVVGLALSFYVGFVPGVRGPNRYGADPTAG